MNCVPIQNSFKLHQVSTVKYLQVYTNMRTAAQLFRNNHVERQKNLGKLLVNNLDGSRGKLSKVRKPYPSLIPKITPQIYKLTCTSDSKIAYT